MPESNAAVAQKKTDENGKKKERSPGYPGISLQTAITRAKQLHDVEKQTPASVSVAANDWGMKPTSSSTLITIAALKGYGLVSETGVGDNRKIQVTDAARRIILDERPDSAERVALIKAAALSPKMHRILWNKWGSELPSDANMIYSLTFDHKFNANTVGEFIRLYRDTIRYAKLSESDKVSPEVEDKGSGDGIAGGYVPKVGDFVQWEPNGILQFAEPKPIQSISGDGKFAFVDGSSTGLPVGDLTLQKKPANQAPGVNVNPLSEKSNMRQDIFSLSEGTVTIQWPTRLSADSIQDLKDWLKIVERKIARSATEESAKEKPNES